MCSLVPSAVVLPVVVRPLVVVPRPEQNVAPRLVFPLQALNVDQILDRHVVGLLLAFQGLFRSLFHLLLQKK